MKRSLIRSMATGLVVAAPPFAATTRAPAPSWW